jgi:hypothetical protein
MTKEELAARLNGREYGSETTNEDIVDAMDSGLVIIHGASDDLVEINGAISEEIGASSEGSEFWLFRSGIPVSECGDDDCPYFKRERDKAEMFFVEYTTTGWHFTTSVPHAGFTIFEGGEVYGTGIVIDVRDLPPAP